MGREVRFVKEGWEHPKWQRGKYIALHPFDWYDPEEEELNDLQLAEQFMPNWKEEELTHMMMYETCSEGTPISPAFPKDQKEELARWLADNEASAFGDITTTYENWLNTINQGCAVGCMINTKTGKITPGTDV